MKNDGIVILLSDARGIYIPRDFVEDFDLSKWSGISQEDIDICKDVEHEFYWDAWSDILDNASYTDPDGNVYRLYQDGNLWAYCLERMTLEEQKNFFNPYSIDEYHVPDGFSLYEIGSQFVCALCYGDYSGLEDNEIEILESFVEVNGADIRDAIDYDEFGECEITGRRGKTCLVLLKDKEEI